MNSENILSYIMWKKRLRELYHEDVGTIYLPRETLFLLPLLRKRLPNTNFFLLDPDVIILGKNVPKIKDLRSFFCHGERFLQIISFDQGWEEKLQLVNQESKLFLLDPEFYEDVANVFRMENIFFFPTGNYFPDNITEHIIQYLSRKDEIQEFARFANRKYATEWKYWKLKILDIFSDSKVIRKTFFVPERNPRDRFYEILFERNTIYSEILAASFPVISDYDLNNLSALFLKENLSLGDWSIEALENFLIPGFEGSRYRSLENFIEGRYGGWDRLLNIDNLYLNMKNDPFINLFNYVLLELSRNRTLREYEDFIISSGHFLPSLYVLLDKGNFSDAEKIIEISSRFPYREGEIKHSCNRLELSFCFPARFRIDILELAIDRKDIVKWLFHHGFDPEYEHQNYVLPVDFAIWYLLEKYGNYLGGSEKGVDIREQNQDIHSDPKIRKVVTEYLQYLLGKKMEKGQDTEINKLLAYSRENKLNIEEGFPQALHQISDLKFFRKILIDLSTFNLKANNYLCDNILHSFEVNDDRFSILLDVLGSGFYPKTMIKYHDNPELLSKIMKHCDGILSQNEKIELREMISRALERNTITRGSSFGRFLEQLGIREIEIE